MPSSTRSRQSATLREREASEPQSTGQDPSRLVAGARSGTTDPFAGPGPAPLGLDLRFLTVVRRPSRDGRGVMGAETSRRVGRHRRRYVPLFERVAGVNALLLIAAVAVTIVVLAPQKFLHLRSRRSACWSLRWRCWRS